MDSGREKKVILLVAIVLFVLASLILYKFFPSDDGYSDNPKNWIDNGDVDLKEATKGVSYVNIVGQQYDTKEIETVFVHDGFYLGNKFENAYFEDQQLLIRFTQNIEPNNGVPEGFILERLENNEPVAYIFLDEEWREKVPYTNIIWGDTYQNSQEFLFNQKEDGVYYIKIKDDRNRFSEDFKIHFGGIVVGSIYQEEVRNQDYSGSIVIRLK